MNAATFARHRARIEREYQGRGRQYKRVLAHLIKDARAALVVMDRKIVGYRLPNGEMVCTKTRYQDEARALHDMGRIQADNLDGHRVQVRAYYCVNCKGFHLTSQRSRHAA